MNTKQALSEAMNAAAGHSNRVHALQRFAQALPEAQFMDIAGQHPSTIARDLEHAQSQFRRLKGEYEAHCESIGEPAYTVYSED